MPMPAPSTLLIVADDLTGAADSAARCRHAGLPASIAVTPPRLPLPAGALALQTDSRHLAPEDAGHAVARLCTPLVGQPAVWYKKIDSTLRGNIGAELDALLDLSGAPCAVLSPGFPAQGRGLEHGYLVHADTPPGTLHLPTLLAGQSRRPVASLELATVRAGAAELCTAIVAARRSGAELLSVDALTDADLQTIMAAVEQAEPQALFCGSAGLVGSLARALDVDAQVYGRPSTVQPRLYSLLFVVGSGSPMARRQIETLSAQLAPDAATDGTVIIRHSRPERGERVSVTLLHLPPPVPGTPLDGPAARRLAAHLAQAAEAHVRAEHPDALVLVGGDTAVSLLARLEVARLQVIAELLPGMPLTLAELDGPPPLHVVLKAGNHGDPDTLLDLARLLTVRG